MALIKRSNMHNAELLSKISFSIQYISMCINRHELSAFFNLKKGNGKISWRISCQHNEAQDSTKRSVIRFDYQLLIKIQIYISMYMYKLRCKPCT